MRLTIRLKLFLTLLLTCITVIMLMVGFIQWSFKTGLLQYVNTKEQQILTPLSERFGELYQQHGNWERLAALPSSQWRRFLYREVKIAGFLNHRNHKKRTDHSRGEERREYDNNEKHSDRGKWRDYRKIQRPPPDLIKRIHLLDSNKQPVRHHSRVSHDWLKYPIHNDQQIIGYLTIEPRNKLSDDRDLRFLQQQKHSIILIAIAILALIGVISLWLSNQLVKPIQALRTATQHLANGDYKVRLDNRSNDEIGELSRDFNLLSQRLAEHESARRQWVADIAHELRTPLSTLQGEIEAILDGIRPATPDNIASLHEESRRLNRLVDDLYQLSLADCGALNYDMRDVNLTQIIASALDRFTSQFQQQNFTVTTELTETAQYQGDEQRLLQLFTNLFKNSLHYTDAPGSVHVALHPTPVGYRIDIHDSSPTVPIELIDKLFERLYRVENSRNRRLGGAGLGLSICQKIVEAHHGSIIAEQSPYGGLHITITLPHADNKDTSSYDIHHTDR